MPIAEFGIGWFEGGWWSLSTIQAGQGLLFDRTVRLEEVAMLTEVTMHVVPALDASHDMIRLM